MNQLDASHVRLRTITGIQEAATELEHTCQDILVVCCRKRAWHRATCLWRLFACQQQSAQNTNKCRAIFRSCEIINSPKVIFEMLQIIIRHLHSLGNRVFLLLLWCGSAGSSTK